MGLRVALARHGLNPNPVQDEMRGMLGVVEGMEQAHVALEAMQKSQKRHYVQPQLLEVYSR